MLSEKTYVWLQKGAGEIRLIIYNHPVNSKCSAFDSYKDLMSDKSTLSATNKKKLERLNEGEEFRVCGYNSYSCVYLRRLTKQEIDDMNSLKGINDKIRETNEVIAMWTESVQSIKRGKEKEKRNLVKKLKLFPHLGF